jgi:hypothetical protein
MNGPPGRRYQVRRTNEIRGLHGLSFIPEATNPSRHVNTIAIDVI